MYNNQQNNLAPPPEVTPPQKVLRWDRDYFSTLPGILKLIQLMCNVIGFICIKVSWSFVSAIFYNLLYWFGNIISLFLFFAYSFHLVEKYDRWPWHKYELFFCVIMTLAYIVCSIFATVIGESVGYAVGFFGFCAIIAYGFDGYLKYKGWKGGLPPQ